MNSPPVRRFAALLLCAVAFEPLRAQTPPPAPPVAETLPDVPEIDPDQPLAPLPELEVEFPNAGQRPDGARPPRRDDSDRVALRYTVEVKGLSEVGLGGRFRELSALETGDSLDNLAQLDRRAREDSALIDKLLRAEGYYGGVVDIDITPAEAEGGAAKVAISVAPGNRYTFDRIEVATPPSAPRELILDTLGLKVGDPVEAQAVQDAEDRVRVKLPEMGYPFASVGDREIGIDHETQKASYRVPIVTGQAAVIGDIRVEGDQLVSSRHIERLTRFRRGETFNSAELEDLRRALVATGLFGSVGVRASEANEPGVVDIIVALQAAPLRTLAGQAGYSTGEGFRVEASWQHRNMFPPEGALTARGVLGTEEQRLAGEIRFNNFRQRDNILLLRSEISNEDRDAYQARTFTLGASLARETNFIWQKKWYYSLGAELVATDERDTNLDTGMSRRRTFFIGALPGSLSYDGTDDLLDPTGGFRLSARVSPEASFQGSAFGYLKGQIDASAYQPFGDRVVLAGRVRAGSIFGADRDRIAPSRRFYSGGGGSVRGFGFQEIGPRDPFDDPIGGRSLAEASIEARIRFGDFGVVPFIDAGQIYTSTLPRFDTFRFGAGIGARYYTTFGPIRFDVATPLDPRSGDPKVGVYVSIGQAF
ncbi:BamA/TamA family outer membrane protein [Sphingoaurantiacus capsulatus]|uniref:BamA/TamA family outer membrane protein n=1 Tax=Sphingoaurantiacus capsulatus TaxID=1771310 RepID=A0ABV7XDE7_9SPHN